MPSSIPRFQVYGLYEPETDELRYIGQTVEVLSRRLYHHLHDAKVKLGNKSEHLEWLRGLLARGLQPVIRVIVDCQDAEEMDRTERDLILEHHNKGTRLTNMARRPGISLSPLKTYTDFIDPEGNALVITDLVRFCQKHGLRTKSMYELHFGRIKSYKGYTRVGLIRLPASYEKVWSGFVRPDGTQEPPFLNMQQFCKDNKLNRSAMQRLAKGKKQQYLGWTHIGIE